MKEVLLDGSAHVTNEPAERVSAQTQPQTDNRPATIQRRAMQAAIDGSPRMVAQRKENRTGLPDQLKAGIESLSGHSLDDVKVHYNSAQPAQLQAHAYAQGTAIHVAPGQEQHLPHEAWHVAQQKQGRVRATTQLKGTAVNDSTSLEREADVMGQRAAQLKPQQPRQLKAATGGAGVAQRAKKTDKRKKQTDKKNVPKRAKLTGITKPRRARGTGGTRTRTLPGTHGYKKNEQKRLTTAYGSTVSGDTHESEHTIGFEPLNQTSGLKRGTAGRARNLENKAPAYQEVKALHRDHIGTGTTNTRDGSGFNSHEYRQAQRQLVVDGDVGSAIQLNQLGYAFDPSFKGLPSTIEGQQANDSFDSMIENLSSVTYAQGNNDVAVNVPPKQQAEAYLSRRAAQSGKFPSVAEENEARRKFGLEELMEEEK